MSNTTPAQAAALADLTSAAMDRQLYVLQGVAAIVPAEDHRMISRILKLADAVEATGYPLDLDAVLSDAEAAALAQALLG